MQLMGRPCCAKDCAADAVVREPLEFDDLILHVPLCRDHDVAWREFAAKRQKALRKVVKDARLAGWTLDAALAYAVLPVDHRG
jgi:hypothetical protein